MARPKTANPMTEAERAKEYRRKNPDYHKQRMIHIVKWWETSHGKPDPADPRLVSGYHTSHADSTLAERQYWYAKRYLLRYYPDEA